MTSRTGMTISRRWLRATGPEELSAIYQELHQERSPLRASWGAYLVPGLDDVRAALTDANLARLDSKWRDSHTPGWRSSPVTEKMCSTFMQQNPPEHSAARRPVTAVMSARAMQAVEPAVRELADRETAAFAALLRDRGTADITQLCERLPAVVMADLAGLARPDEDLGPRLGHLARTVILAGEIFRPQSELRAAEQAAAEFEKLISRAVRDARRQGPRGFLAAWADAPAADVHSRLWALLIAGQTTSSALLADLAMLLLGDSTARDLARDDGYRARLIAETLRWDPGVKVATRHAVAGCQIGGRRIEAGQVVHLLIGAASQDPARFDRPARCDPDRVPVPGIPFGRGIHYCPGASLTEILADAFVLSVLRHLGPAQAAGNPVRQTGPTFTPITSLRVAWPGHPDLPGPREPQEDQGAQECQSGSLPAPP